MTILRACTVLSHITNQLFPGFSASSVTDGRVVTVFTVGSLLVKTRKTSTVVLAERSSACDMPCEVLFEERCSSA